MELFTEGVWTLNRKPVVYGETETFRAGGGCNDRIIITTSIHGGSSISTRRLFFVELGRGEEGCGEQRMGDPRRRPAL